MAYEPMASRVEGRKDWTFGMEDSTVRDERDDSFITHDSSSSSSSSSSDDDEEAVRGGVLAGDVSDTDSERGDDAAAPRAAREEERSPMLPRRGGETRTRKRDRKNVASWLASGLENASSDDDDDDDVTRGNDAEATRRRANREAGAPIAVRDGNGNRNRNRFADHPGNAAADPTLRARRHGHKQKRRASRRDVEGAAEKANRRETRETKRRLARRRAYAPASAALVARLAAMYFAFVVIVLADVFATAMACYVNPGAHVMNDGADATWTAFCLMALIGAPAMAAHLAGWALLPAAWPETFPDLEKKIGELGGKLFFRFCRARADGGDARRGGNAGGGAARTRFAVNAARETLSRALPNTTWEIEFVGEEPLSVASASVREYTYPESVALGGGGRVGTCDLLAFASERSAAGWGDWVIHMGSDGVLNQRAVDAVAAHCARESRLVALASSAEPHARRGAFGAVFPGVSHLSGADGGWLLDDGYGRGAGELTRNQNAPLRTTAWSWLAGCAASRVAGETLGSTRLCGDFGAVLTTLPSSFVVLPSELERGRGWASIAGGGGGGARGRRESRGDVSTTLIEDDDSENATVAAAASTGAPPGAGMELTAFALRCARTKGTEFAWLDAGAHARVIPDALAFFIQRARFHAAARTLWWRNRSGSSVSGGRVGKGAGSTRDRDRDRGVDRPIARGWPRIFIATHALSSGFARLAPLLTTAAPFLRHGASTPLFAMNAAVGVVTASVRAEYAVGFFASVGGSRLASGRANSGLAFAALFLLTVALVPVFSFFELGALVGSLFVGAGGRGGRGDVGVYGKGYDEAKIPLRAAGAAASDADPGAADVERGERRRVRWTRETRV